MLMHVGDRLRFEVPPELAFGPRSQHNLPANSRSIWELELVKFVAPMPEPEFAELDPDKTTRTASGIEYEIIEPGTGKSPSGTDSVTVHYAGWLTNGTNFDSSFSRGEPNTFRMNGVIPGWTEGVQLMKEGATYKFRIPSTLAYGVRGQAPAIPPNATLIFVIHLISVN